MGLRNARGVDYLLDLVRFLLVNGAAMCEREEFAGYVGDLLDVVKAKHRVDMRFSLLEAYIADLLLMPNILNSRSRRVLAN